MLWNSLTPSQIPASYPSQAVRKWIFSVGLRCTKHFTGYNPAPVPLICWMQPVPSSHTAEGICSHQQPLAPFLIQKSPAQCWRPNCQGAMAGKGFTLQPQRISGHIQTAKGQPGAVPYKKTIFWFWTLPSALKSSPGICFLFDSLKKSPMGGREKNTSQ